MNRDLPEQFDYVIVGAGSAGCVLANRLSADPAIRVCLIEAGGADWYPWIHIPVGYFYTFDNPRTDWRFRTEPDAGLNGRSIKYPRGRVLGGTSSINGMVYIRGQAADYDGWRQQGNIGWSWNDVLPYFRKSEDQARGANEAHGVGGELRVEDLRASWEVLDAFCDAAVQTGIPRTADFNGGDNEGVGYFQVTQKNGQHGAHRADRDLTAGARGTGVRQERGAEVEPHPDDLDAATRRVRVDRRSMNRRGSAVARRGEPRRPASRGTRSGRRRRPGCRPGTEALARAGNRNRGAAR